MAYLSIGKVAETLDLPAHTIRFWLSNFDHIEFETKNGRRYFDENAVEELKKIKNLSKKGVKLEGIKQMVKYHKIREEKIEEANKEDLLSKIDDAIEVLNGILDN